MKKILIAFIVAIASFSSAFAAKYDFTSVEKLGESMGVQAQAEGLSMEEMAEGFQLYSIKLALTNLEAVQAAEAKGDDAVEACLLKLYSETMGEKSLTELFKGLEEEVKKLVVEMEAAEAAKAAAEAK